MAPSRAGRDLAGSRALFRIGERLVRTADGLVGERNALASLLLYREALAVLGRAVWLRVHPEGGATGESPPVGIMSAPALAEAIRALSGETPAISLEILGALEGALSTATWAALGTEALFELRQQAREVARLLVRALKASDPEIIRAKKRAYAVAAAVAAAALGAGVVALLQPRNVARGKPVQTSGAFAASVAPADGSALVNGVIERSYGVHTEPSTLGWVQVDLEKVYRLQRIVVFNRAEERYQNEGLPFALDVSSDGQTFTEVEQRTTPFSQREPWRLSLANQRARFVRIRNVVPAYVALAELEVYGDHPE